MSRTHIQRLDIDYKGVSWCGYRTWRQNITFADVPTDATCKVCRKRFHKITFGLVPDVQG